MVPWTPANILLTLSLPSFHSSLYYQMKPKYLNFSFRPVLHFSFHDSSIRKADVFQRAPCIPSVSVFWCVFFFVHKGLVLLRLRAALNNSWMWEAYERGTVLACDQLNTQKDSICLPRMTESKGDNGLQMIHNARILSKIFTFSALSSKECLNKDNQSHGKQQCVF